MLVKENPQLTFDAIPFLKFPYKADHPLMQLEKAIQWDTLLDALAEFFSHEEGRPTIPLRAKTGTLILKFVKTMRDRETVNRKIRFELFCTSRNRFYRGNLHLRGRIVSFHKEHVRPIMRGKFPVATEFGPKVLLAVVRGYTYVVKSFQDNVSDTRMTVPALRWFKTMFGRFPREL